MIDPGWAVVLVAAINTIGYLIGKWIDRRYSVQVVKTVANGNNKNGVIIDGRTIQVPAGGSTLRSAGQGHDDHSSS